MSKFEEIVSTLDAVDGLPLTAVSIQRYLIRPIEYIHAYYGPEKEDIVLSLYSQTRESKKELERVAIVCGMTPATADFSKMQEIEQMCLSVWGEPTNFHHQPFVRSSYKVWKYSDERAWQIYPLGICYTEEIARIVFQAEVAKLVEDIPETHFDGEHTVICTRSISIVVYPDVVLARATAKNPKEMQRKNIEERWLAETKTMSQSERIEYYKSVVEKVKEQEAIALHARLENSGF